MASHHPSNRPQDTQEPLALVGIGCRFPGGVHDADSFWDLLIRSRCAITEVPAERWDSGRYYHPDHRVPGRMISGRGGFVDNLKGFDARFWGIAPREAMRMDPQQRWLLEVAWEAIEDAGTAPRRLRGANVGVFVGISSSDYGSLQLSDHPNIDAHTNSGSASSIAANRISYLFDFKGPSLSVDTACSSALAAFSLACQSIRSGACEAALAGGVNALITPHNSIGFSKATMLSPSGRCFAFDARADGYVRGEGAGLLYIKRLDKALEAGDRIYAVVRSAVMNQDGHTSSLTVPSVESQSAMLRQAYGEAGIAPRRVVYVEAHGTGTPVGDPIEAEALGKVLSAGRPAGERCLIGSVKTNIGHLESASGVAGLIKAALMLQRNRVPPNLNFATPNPDIAFDQLGLEVPTRPQPLPHPGDAPPVIGVNSFGFGGANAHAVLEAAPSREPPARQAAQNAQRPCLLPISARGDESLRGCAEAFRDFLADDPPELRAVCRSAGVHKEHHEQRLVAIAGSTKEMRERLDTWLRDPDQADGIVSGRAAAETGPLVFVFTGQGPQWWAMGRRLLERESVVRRTIHRIDEILAPLAGWSLIEEMSRSEQTSNIHRTAIAQPAIFALQVALAQLWRSWGIEPAKVIGHSVGEVAAACCAGIFSLEDAVRIIYHRSRLQDTTGGHGGMVAAGIPEAEVDAAIGDAAGRVQLTAINSPDLVTLAGDTEPLERIAAKLEGAGRFVRRLPVNYAFHTHQMEPIKEELLAALADIQPGPGAIPFVSTVTGGPLAGEKLDAGYWWRNVRRPVRFGPAVSELIREGHELFQELGPHPSLKSAINQSLAAQGKQGALFHSLRRDTDDSLELLQNLAGLHTRGVEVDWSNVNQSAGPFVRLPQYPWHHEPHWLDRGEWAARLLPEPHPLLGTRVRAAQPTWSLSLDPHLFPYLEDHRIWDGIVFPAAGYAEIGLALARELFPDEPYAVEELESTKALFVSADKAPSLRIVFDPQSKAFSVYSSVDNTADWELNARGRLLLPAPTLPAFPAVDLDAIGKPLSDCIGHEEYCSQFAAIGYQFGPSFSLVRNVRRRQGEALAEIVAPQALLDGMENYCFHPALLDACFQASRGVQLVPADAIAEDYLYLPESIRRVRLYRSEPPTHLWAHAKRLLDDGKSIETDILVYDGQGERVAEILGFRVTRMEHKAAHGNIEDCLYRLEWQPGPLPEDQESGDETTGATHLLFADRTGLADALAEKIEQRGDYAVCIRAGTKFGQEGKREFTVAPDSEDDLRRVFSCAGIDEHLPASIMHCWSLDHPDAERLSPETLMKAQQTGVLSALRLAQVLNAQEWPSSPRVCFVTRDMQPVGGDDRGHGIASSPIVGLERVANNEHFPLRWTLIDLDRRASTFEAEGLLNEIMRDDGENEVAYRDDLRYVHRLQRVREDDLPERRRNAVQPGNGLIPYRLQIGRPGSLSQLSLNETRRRDPAPGEIELRVAAGGINFRDLMKALAIYPGNPVDLLWLGDDFSGTVERTGEGVTDIEPGDPVVGIAPYAFQGYLTVNRRMVFEKPPQMSFEEAATLPTVFLTAHYAINELAHMQPGEKILIHAGTGGVGQAAIQIARHLGLEIFATAGTPEKRQLLKEMGVAHTMSSRTLEFADQIMEITQGRGVDAVLNSLAGDFIPKSLSVLAPFGRFLEIGKVDIYNNTRIGLKPLKDNISYFVIDLAQYLEKKPAYVTAMLATLSARFEAGDYGPLPHQIFPITEATAAFRHMAQGKHIGKNVLSFRAGEIPIGPCTEEGHLFRADASYLITGGAGGFGLEIAKWMAKQGARQLVLMSRSGARELEGEEIERLRSAGVNVVDARGDVTREEDVRRVIGQVHGSLPPLGGVIHGAMVLDDDFLADLDEKRFNKTLHPKMLGAWNLHLATRELPLEHFICLSSYSSLIGAPRQASYNAGNAFLDALAHYRRGLGLPALTINWGAISGAGFVERNRKTAEYLDKIGLHSFTLNEAWHIFRGMLRRDAAQIGAARVDWPLLARLSPALEQSKLYAPVARGGAQNQTGISIRERIETALPNERAGIIEDFLAAQVADVFGIEAQRVDRSAPLGDLGLDSLMAVELMTRMEAEFRINISMSRLLNGPCIQELAQIVLQLLPESTASEGAETDTDFEAEAQLDPSIVPDGMAPIPASSAAHILLTGATGFVGAFLLDELLRRTQSKIVCLVRAEGAAKGLQRIRANLNGYGLEPAGLEARVEALAGDLSKPLLGLTAPEFDKLAARIDVIYHNGAVVNLALPYQALRGTNVLGTQEILRLACRTRIKPTHFVSTFTVQTTDDNRGREVTEDEPLPPCDALVHDYSKSKWVAERLVTEASERGLPVVVYRPGHVAGHSRTGVSNTGDLLHTLILTGLSLGTTPLLEGTLDVTPVDYVAQAIVELSRHPESLGQTFHLTNPHPLQQQELVQWMQSSGLNVRPVPYGQWRGQLLELADQTQSDTLKLLAEELAPRILAADDSAVPVVHPHYDCGATLSALSATGIACPPADTRLFSTYLAYLQRMEVDAFDETTT